MFAQVDYDLTEKTTLTLGLRYTEDTQEFSGRQLAKDGTLLGTASASEDFPETTWRLALGHQLADDMLVFASYNRGFKSGAFSTSGLDETPVNPETIDAYEVGFKSEYFDRTMRLNVAAFYYDYAELQLTRVESGTNVLLNAAEAEVLGGEAELAYIPQIDTGYLQVNLNVSILESEYKSFPDGPFFTPTGVGGNSKDARDLSGNELIRSPDWTASLSADYSVDYKGGELGVNLTYYYNDGFAWQPDNSLYQDSYNIVNAQVRYAFGVDRKYRVTLWGKNLTDEYYATYLTQSELGDLASAGDPRAFGVSFEFTFD